MGTRGLERRMDILFNGEPHAVAAISSAILAMTSDLPWPRELSQAGAALSTALTAAIVGRKAGTSHRKVRCSVAFDRACRIILIFLTLGQRFQYTAIADLEHSETSERVLSDPECTVFLIDLLNCRRQRSKILQDPQSG